MSQLKVNILSSFCWWFLITYQQNYAFSSSCGSTKSLNVKEGEDIILQLNQTSFTSVTWDFEEHLIANTTPGQPIELAKYSFSYTGRLFTLADGSLKIINLKTNDRRIYRAVLFAKDSSYLCAQLYDLRINESSRMSSNIAVLESCGSTRQLFSTLGGEVTLQLPNETRVAFITWDINNIDHIAITRPGQNVVLVNNSYVGRLSAMIDGSLKMFNLTTEDQRVYRAEVFIKNWIYRCTQIYDVRVRKVFRGYSLQTIIRLALSACILVITFFILVHHMKTVTVLGSELRLNE
ncbi:uncharacterized protein LOC142108165 [Mixophyes fleayi]|uniref:uncharacterized protein LOC142108165 n=1 Tax=Mixophyes fleayi TaxID=3061075 RepID=UPI003F4E08BF